MSTNAVVQGKLPPSYPEVTPGLKDCPGLHPSLPGWCPLSGPPLHSCVCPKMATASMLCLTLDIISHKAHVHVNKSAMNECRGQSTNDRTNVNKNLCNPLSLLKAEKPWNILNDVAAASLTSRSHLLLGSGVLADGR